MDILYMYIYYMYIFNGHVFFNVVSIFCEIGNLRILSRYITTKKKLCSYSTKRQLTQTYIKPAYQVRHVKYFTLIIYSTIVEILH